MSRTRTTLANTLAALLVCSAFIGAGCETSGPEDPDARDTALDQTPLAPTNYARKRPPSPPPGTPPPLIPPAPFVLASDGVTHLSLEEAKILKPNSARWVTVLGKALFWDEQAGSDGNACASCHFHAGADSRLVDQINPGFNDATHGATGDTAFGSQRSDTGTVAPGRMPSGAVPDATYELIPADMPLHRLEDETNRNSRIVTTTNDRISSSGSFAGTFERVGPIGARDVCSSPDILVFHAGDYSARQVEPRNTPTFHNSAFNHRNFWDNRANNLFNGVGTFGLRDVLGDPSDPSDVRNNNRLIIVEDDVPTLGYLKVENASTASQAVAPPLSAVEMSCARRTFADVGRRLLMTTPLRGQEVSPSDSTLGPYVSATGRGLAPQYDYAALIKKIFHPKYWALEGRYSIVGGELVADPNGYTQMEMNFSMFWGLAIAQYEATQISDQSEFDALQAAGRLVMSPSFAPAGPGVGKCISPTGDVDPLLLRGCTIFSRLNPSPFLPTPPDGIRGGNCFVCHNAQGGGAGRSRQPLLAEGAIQNGEPFSLFLTVTDVKGINDLRDQGSANIGLRNVFSDQMSGRTDPYGNPLSFGRQLWNYLDGKPGAVLDPALQRAIDSGAVPTRVALDQPTPANTFRKLEVDGSTKASILRNVALTPPYFSWGGYASLRQVLKVYNRGMSRRDITVRDLRDAQGSNCISGDDTGSGPDGNQSWPIQGSDCNTNTTGLIVSLGLSDCDANGVPNAACTAKSHTVATDDLAALERFMKSLTDRRVQCDQAPFDHPQLRILTGHRQIDADGDGKADDIVFSLPAVGAAGYSRQSGLCIPNAGDLFAPGMHSRTGGTKVPLP